MRYEQRECHFITILTERGAVGATGPSPGDLLALGVHTPALTLGRVALRRLELTLSVALRHEVRGTRTEEGEEPRTRLRLSVFPLTLTTGRLSL